MRAAARVLPRRLAWMGRGGRGAVACARDAERVPVARERGLWADAAAVQSGIGEGAQPEGVAGILAAMAAVGLASAALCSPSQQPGSDPAVSQKLQDIKSRLKPLLDRAREGRHHPALRPRVTMDYAPYGETIAEKNSGTEPAGSYWMSFPIHPQADTLQTLISIIQALPADEKVSLHDDGTNEGLSLVFRKNEASFLIARDEFVLYTDAPPTDNDLRAFTAAYKAGTLPSARSGGNILGSYKIGDALGDLGDSDAWLDFFKDLQEKIPNMSEIPKISGRKSDAGQNRSSPQSQVAAVKTLRGLGAHVYLPADENGKKVGWDTLAGYESVKQDVEDTVLLALKHPEAYEKIARATRKVYESNRPKAVIFDGPPGTGKTTTARIIASQAGVPMIYIPVESVVSKWYGESAKRLAQVFDSAEEMGSSIIFLDEIDALATKRGGGGGVSGGGGGMHEATRRTLSVLLRRLEGYTSKQSTIFVCATNRREDLDPALLSRFDLSVHFGLPRSDARSEIFSRYAQHLDRDQLSRLARHDVSRGMAGRDIKEVCQAAERRWASKIIRGVVPSPADGGASADGPNFGPPVEEYIEAAQARARSMRGQADDDFFGDNEQSV